MRITQVDWAGEVVTGSDQAHKSIDQVVNIAEGARLAAVSVQRDVLATQGLHDKVGHDPSVVRMHPRPVGVEDAHHLDAGAVLAEVIKEQRLGAALAFVVAGAWTHRIDVAAIVLGLWMYRRIAVHLAGRCLHDLRADPLCQTKHGDRAYHAGLGGLHWVVLVVHRRGRARQVVDFVDLDVQGESDVVPHRLEVRIADQVGDVVLAAGEIVVDAQHIVSVAHQTLTEMRPKETGAAGHQHPFARQSHQFLPPRQVARSAGGPNSRGRSPACSQVISE